MNKTFNASIGTALTATGALLQTNDIIQLLAIFALCFSNHFLSADTMPEKPVNTVMRPPIIVMIIANN